MGSVFGLLAVAIGAFGAHAAPTEQAKAWIETGAGQHMAHSLAILGCGFVLSQGGKGAGLSAVLFGAGICLFSGALYALALGAPKAVASAAPLGGLSFMLGWANLAWVGLRLGKARL